LKGTEHLEELRVEEWIHLFQNRNQQRDLVNTVMNLGFPKERGEGGGVTGRTSFYGL
jgi:hypothetical protein